MKKVEIFISGAGIAGLTLACLLAKNGIETAIIDPNTPTKNKKPEHGTRTTAVMSSLLPIFDDIGILDEIRSYSAPLEALRIIDAPSNHFKKSIEHTFHASEINQDAFSWNIPNNLLLHTLYTHAQTYKALTIINSALKTIDHTNTGIILETEAGETFSAALLVGADGRNSKVRELANIKTKTTDFKQTAITTILDHSTPHNNTSTEIHKSGGPFTMVPLQGNTSSLVWIEKTDNAEKILKQDIEGITAEIQNMSREIIGKITLNNPVQSFPLISLKSNNITAKRIALIAEAAHILSPTGAQGLNLSLRDIKDLHNTIIETKELGGDIGSNATLSTYEKARKQDINLRLGATNLLNHFVKQDTPLHQTIRRGAFSFLSDTEPFRTHIMKKGFQS